MRTLYERINPIIMFYLGEVCLDCDCCPCICPEPEGPEE